MSAPARTYFCKNGHVVIHFNHGDWFEENECPKSCPGCDSTEIKSVVEWGDLDYSSSESVPITPIRYEPQYLVNVERRTVKGQPLPVYDMFKLFGKSENEEG